MNLDIRLPIGLLFVLLGGLLCAYGVFTFFSQPELYERARWASTSTSGGALFSCSSGCS